MSKEFFNFSNDLYVCSTYIHPSNSSREKNVQTDHFMILNETITKYRNLGKVILCGDFNSRVGILPDFISEKEQNPEFDIYYESTQNTIPRISKDKNINCYGIKLIETCASHNRRIANSRINGQIICYNYKGASAVDYLILDDYLIPNVVSFEISAPQFRSCHSILHLTLKVDLITIEEHLLNDLPIFYKWNNASRDLYKVALANTFSSHEMTILNNKLDMGDIDSAVDQVSDIFISAANRCLTKIRRKKKKKVSTIKESGMIMIATRSNKDFKIFLILPKRFLQTL